MSLVEKLSDLGIAHVTARQPLDRRRNRGAQQQRLPRLRAAAKNFFDVGPKADVEHPIGLVEDDDQQVVELERAATHVIQNASGRANDDFDPPRKFFDLSPDRLAAIDGHRVDLATVRELDDFLADLHGQLARGNQDQGLRSVPALGRLEAFQNRNYERGRLAGSGAGLP